MMPALFKKHKNSIGTIVRAPGKLVLTGEYAVLDGAPSIVIAIDRGVECEIKEGNGISTPMNDERFVKEALVELCKTKHFQFREWNPIENISSNQKPGFGGSAAACVVSCFIAKKAPNDAFDIHKKVQGSGSGIDIAASIHGGMFSFKQGKIKSLTPILPVVIWTGSSAKTGPRIEKYLQWKSRKEFVAKSTVLTNQFMSEPVNTIRDLYKLHQQLHTEAKIEYLTPEIIEIVSLAEQFQGAAKPSGAGGGDCIVAFFVDELSKEEFISVCRQKYVVIDVNSSQGVHSI
jgi:phosphomevalonate kinase